MSLVERRIPSLEVGEYCEWEDRRGKYLFPLAEEGSYGPLPQYKTPGKWMEPSGYSKREKKPKLERYEREPSPRKTPPRSTPPRSIIAKPKRATSLPPDNMSDVASQKSGVSSIPSRPRVSYSVPPSSPTPQLDLDLSEMTGRLRVSRAISQDIEDSLCDRSVDEEIISTEVKITEHHINTSND